MKIDELVFDERGPAIAESDIVDAEARLGVVLPEDYKRFLLLHNGGFGEYETLDEELGITHWMAICDRSSSPICSLVGGNEQVASQLADGACKSFIIIGISSDNKHIVMKVGNKKRGAIGVFDWGVMERMSESKMMYRSFTDLVKNLKPYTM